MIIKFFGIVEWIEDNSDFWKYVLKFEVYGSFVFEFLLWEGGIFDD